MRISNLPPIANKYQCFALRTEDTPIEKQEWIQLSLDFLKKIPPCQNSRLSSNFDASVQYMPN